jgi:hypothetical protein
MTLWLDLVGFLLDADMELTLGGRWKRQYFFVNWVFDYFVSSTVEKSQCTF